ncbi:MAG TPA: response regulator [Firmicutes bacterium]|nr:response regulator [Bacillota bacterium]
MPKLLVVDDEPGIRRLLEEVFRDDRYQVVAAASGKEALAKWKEWEPDLVLLDMKMPGMDGLEVLRRMAGKYSRVPVIIMTAYGELRIVDEALNLGARGYVTKPFDVLELRNTVDRLLAE